MKASVMYGAGDVRVEDVPDASISEPTDALVRVTLSCICGSDLWPYASMDPEQGPARMGHEFVGVVEDVGSEVSTVKKGDLVIAPFVVSDGTCEFCRDGLQTSCVNGGFWGREGIDGGQGEAVRVPHADGTLVAVGTEPDAALMPSLLTLSDVFCTGHHAALSAGVGEGSMVCVIGDGAVGISGVIAAKRLGADRIVIFGRHTDRTDLALELGATDVVAERGREGAAKFKELAGGKKADAVLECVGTDPSMETAIAVARPGGAVGRVGLPQTMGIPSSPMAFLKNVTITGGIAPARAYIEEMLPEVLDGKIEPGRVFDRTIPLADTPDGYRAMADREAIKVMLTP